jgi:hypothetical protein
MLRSTQWARKISRIHFTCPCVFFGVYIFPEGCTASGCHAGASLCIVADSGRTSRGSDRSGDDTLSGAFRVGCPLFLSPAIIFSIGPLFHLNAAMFSVATGALAEASLVACLIRRRSCACLPISPPPPLPLPWFGGTFTNQCSAHSHVPHLGRIPRDHQQKTFFAPSPTSPATNRIYSTASARQSRVDQLIIPHKPPESPPESRRCYPLDPLEPHCRQATHPIPRHLPSRHRTQHALPRHAWYENRVFPEPGRRKR